MASREMTRPDVRPGGGETWGSTTAAPGEWIEMECPNCAKAVAQSWAFCEWCGHRLGATRTATPAAPQDGIERVDAEPTRRRRWPTRRVVVASVAVVAGGGLITTAVLAHLDTRHNLSETRQRLASTQLQLSDTTGKLQTSEAALARVRDDLNSKIKTLQSTQRKLQSTQKALAGVRGSLEDADSKIELQAGQIETLKSCLKGVSSALAYAAYSDLGAAVAALEAVEVSCERAYRML